MNDFVYHRPASLREAVALLAEHQGKSKVLAGGTDLMLQLQDGLWAPEHVIDVRAIPELNALTFSQSAGLTIGAATPVRRIETSPIVQAEYPHLASAASEIGSVQIRNLASLGGNICTATPSADSVPALISLGATVRLASVRGERSVELESVFTGVRQTVLAPDELLVDLRIPAPPPHTSGAYFKLATRPQMDLAIVGVASTVSLNPGGTIKTITICLGAVAPTPIRAREAEAILAGAELSESRLAQAGAAAARAARPISDVRASADYRREQCDLVTRRVVRLAVERAMAP